MTAIRRTLILIATGLTVVLGGSMTASAAFSDTTSVQQSITSGTVAPPTGLTLVDNCTTTTTTVKRTVYTSPGTGATSTTYYNSTTTTAASSSNVQGTTTTTEPGPRPNETTTTTVTRNTDLHVTLSWTGSNSRGTNGYRVSARLANGTVSPLMTTAVGTTTVTQVQDADALVYQPSLLVSTLTTYGWTADSPRTRVLSC
ncbi:hypothetical protein GCU60_19695 [Blastococcus saxobsidens]|uniref:Fibronectin type-III domain-containing protein n=1 Tax=Blastococcus saxobsidens TaxID=138336 RepID=A0A6L9W7B8_9ACTN|nr:hypothetical protein [Blastococcus saxobsidens]NEK87965.1 hypothetical protein [Blastococcus saxobsidens]